MSLTTSRRHALAAAAATLGAALLGGPALAQATYPSQPLKLIVPYPAGGATDTLGGPWQRSSRNRGARTSSSRTVPVPQAPSATTWSPRLRPTATRC
jgi:hypothetical protein